MKRFDAIVVGGGPGRVDDRVPARRRRRVACSSLDKARFPRDKPCGGGLTMRAVRQCPVDPTPVVEELVDLVELRFRYGDAVVRRGEAAGRSG